MLDCAGLQPGMRGRGETVGRTCSEERGWKVGEYFNVSRRLTHQLLSDDRNGNSRRLRIGRFANERRGLLHGDDSEEKGLGNHTALCRPARTDRSAGARRRAFRKASHALSLSPESRCAEP